MPPEGRGRRRRKGKERNQKRRRKGAEGGRRGPRIRQKRATAARPARLLQIQAASPSSLQRVSIGGGTGDCRHCRWEINDQVGGAGQARPAPPAPPRLRPRQRFTQNQSQTHKPVRPAGNVRLRACLIDRRARLKVTALG